MLSPFVIRDLHASSSRGSEGETSETLQSGVPLDTQGTSKPAGALDARPHGIVRLSAPEYDVLASSHPRARLTYIDDDDGELITVGSSLELSQRLDERVDSLNQLYLLQEPTSLSHSYPTEMHLFDIRRSNSVSELWKKYEHPVYPESGKDAEVHKPEAEDAAPSHEDEGASNSNAANITSVGNDGSQPLLAAFEAEMSKLLNSPGDPDIQTPQPDPSPSAGAQSEAPRSGNRPNPVDALAQAIHNILGGAEMVRDEVRSKIPELERQLHNAQRALPGHVGSTLQEALATLEAKVRSLAETLNSVSVSGVQTSTSNFQTQPSTGTLTSTGLRTMASEIGQLGQTLFTTFENELGRNQPPRSNQAGEAMSAPEHTANQEQSGRCDTAAPNSAEPLTGMTTVSFENEKETLDSTNGENTKPDAQCNEAPRERNGTFCDNRTPTQLPYRYVVPSRPFAPRYDDTPGSASDAYQRAQLNLPTRNPPFNHPPNPHPLFQPPDVPPPPPAPQSIPEPSIPPASRCLPYPRSSVRVPPSWCTSSPGRASQWAPPLAHGEYLATPSAHNGVGKTSSTVTNNTSPGLPDYPIHAFASNTLFMGNIGFNVSEDMIRDVFASKGFSVDVELPMDSQTGKHPGFGYVKLDSVSAAEAALNFLQGTHIDGHSVNLEFSDSTPIFKSVSLGCRGSENSTAQRHLNEMEQLSKGLGPAASKPQTQALDLPNPVESATEVKKPCLKEQNKKGKDPMTEANPCSSDGSNEASLGASTFKGCSQESTSGLAALLDHNDNGDPEFSARYPSLLPDRSTRRSRFGNAPDHLMPLSPELEMRRFPPVSQLDAHAMAKQRREALSAGASPASKANPDGGKGSEGQNAISPFVPGSFPEDPQAFPEMKEQPKQNLRRSNTVMPVNTSARLTGPFDPVFPGDTSSAGKPLRRHATERHPFHLGHQTRKTVEPMHLPRRASGKHCQPPRFPASGSMANNKASKPASVDDPESRIGMEKQPIDDCVATLVRLGYGGARDGGEARIRMYSEVSGGKVLEAIEMIEEERKAYEQQRWY